MTIESDADRRSFVDTFGTDCTVAGNAVRGIFDNAYVETLGVAGSAPALTCVSSDVATVQVGAAVTVPAASFSGQVAVVQPDGTGMTVLVLERV